MRVEPRLEGLVLAAELGGDGAALGVLAVENRHARAWGVIVLPGDGVDVADSDETDENG
eukprot:CAMPEP_0175838870 /NCGR_PEP_ID=MMETSP0107_2-20121207/18496_1 /TAXON_ID=195067 ORGANISM="Goniomonas pacifica, Strain CCMP1869" /NCGR_SAMPLE_ID=MMETSP0107_2 /ASSEMBLY_ACC=CAM_ASM_000203 /LENGTH=58 /DNA_ID=CAMNT_0017152539 /DNA_START=676 /DNA_END=849 /DNA_ORIENTATION=+